MDYGAGTTLTESLQACQTALAALQRLGCSDQAETALTEAESTSYDAIIGDGSRSDAWKLQTCAQKYTAVMATLATKLTATANTAGREDTDDAARVFGVKGLPGDVASLAISRRDAGDRVADIGDTVTRQRLLAQAVRNGDEVLSHALVASAVELSDADTVNAFVEAYPGLADAVQRLWDRANRAVTTVDVISGWRLGALKPAPLSSMMDYEIAAAAAGKANAGSWNAG
jgi:hypothetical protein